MGVADPHASDVLSMIPMTMTPTVAGVQVSVEAYTENQVDYHVKLLYEAGLIEANEITAANYGPEWEPIALTWDGHEFLEAARDRSRWSKALEIVKEKSGGQRRSVF